MLASFGALLYRIDAGSARVNYGLEKVRFPTALPVGSKVRATATVMDVRRVSAGAQLVLKWVVETDCLSRPVCGAESTTLIVP